MKRGTVLVSICEAWVEATLGRGHGAGTTVRTWRSESAAPWSEDALGECVTVAISALGLRRTSADILWYGGGGNVSVQSLAVDPRDAVDAARLAHAASLGVEPNPLRFGAMTLATDPPSEESMAHTHILSSTINDDTLASLSAAGIKAGVVVRCVTPAATLALSDAVDAAIRQSGDSSDPVVALTIDESVSAIAIARQRYLLHARLVDVGVAEMRSAFTRTIVGAERATADQVRHSEEHLLHLTGIPLRGRQYENGLTSERVFAIMRPALQRLVMEASQSLRFTLAESEVASTVCMLRGPGASIANMPGLLIEELAIASVTPQESGDAFGTMRSRAIRRGSVKTTKEALRARTTVRVAGVGIGLVLALTVLVGHAMTVRAQIARGEAEQQRLVQLLAGTDQSAVTENAMDAEAASALERVILSSLALAPDWSGTLAEIASARTAGLRLESAEAKREGDGSLLTLMWRMSASTGEEAREHIDRLYRTLATSPLIRRVSLGSTEQQQGSDGQDIRFSMTLTLNERRAAWIGENTQ